MCFKVEFSLKPTNLNLLGCFVCIRISIPENVSTVHPNSFRVPGSAMGQFSQSQYQRSSQTYTYTHHPLVESGIKPKATEVADSDKCTLLCNYKMDPYFFFYPVEVEGRKVQHQQPLLSEAKEGHHSNFSLDKSQKRDLGL